MGRLAQPQFAEYTVGGLHLHGPILQSTMPVAVFSYLFALTYNREPDDVASLTMVSTLLSFATLPILLWYVL